METGTKFCPYYFVRKRFLCESKTTKHHGVDVIELQEDIFADLDRCLTLFVVEPAYRNQLLAEDCDHSFVFVNTNGEPFKSSSFSKYLGRLLTRLTGRNGEGLNGLYVLLLTPRQRRQIFCAQVL